MTPLIQVTADEVNHIIYSYLQDSGLLHTAFTLRVEGRLEQSEHFNDYIPRGELVELLTKALLYTEVETHCKGDGLITDCKSTFSLLKRHQCAVDLMDDVVNGAVEKVGKLAVSNGVLEAPLKRKADLPADGDVQNRRVKRSLEPESGETNNELSRDSPMSSEGYRSEELGPDYKRPFCVEPGLSRVDGKKQWDKPGNVTEAGPGDTITPKEAIITLIGHEHEVFVSAWNPVKHGMIATGSKDATVRIWEIPEPPKDPSQFAKAPDSAPVVLKHLPESDQRDITSLDWNADGTLLATGSYDSVLRIWKCNGEFYMSHPQHQGPIFATRFSKSGRWLLSGSLDGTACIWDVAEKKLFMQFRCHAECCLDVDWIDDNTFATCGADKIINIMRIGTQEPLLILKGHENEINQIKLNATKTRLASCSDDSTARIWDIGRLQDDSTEKIAALKPSEIMILTGHEDSIGAIGWCPNRPKDKNELLATASFDGSVRLWDATTGACLKAFRDHKRAAYTLTFSPEGKFLATGSGDGWLYVYQVKNGRQVWAWFAGYSKAGIYEICWQQKGDLNRIALSLETNDVAIVDVTRVPPLMEIK